MQEFRHEKVAFAAFNCCSLLSFPHTQSTSEGGKLFDLWATEGSKI